MRAPQAMPNIPPPNLAALQEKATRLNEQIAGKQIERESVQQTLPRVIMEHVGNDLAGAAEHRKLLELTEEIRQLDLARSVLQEEIHRAHQYEVNRDLDKSLIESRRLAAVLKDKAVNLQNALSQIIVLAQEVKEADAQFTDSLAGAHPSGFTPRSLSVGLMRRIETVLYIESEGTLRPSQGFSHSANELKQDGYADLAGLVAAYTTVALKDRRILLNAEEEREQAFYEKAQKRN